MLVHFWDWRKITEVLWVWVGMVPTVPWAGGAVGRMAAKQVKNRMPRWLPVTATVKVRESLMGSPPSEPPAYIHVGGHIKAVCPQMPGRLLMGQNDVTFRDLLYQFLSDATSLLSYCCVTSGYAFVLQWKLRHD